LHVVPRRPVAVAGPDVDGLGIAVVPLVVAPTVAQVDAAHERDVVGFALRVMRQHELLMVRTGPPDPFVEHDLPSALVDRLGQVDCLLLAEVGLVGMRPPNQSADVDVPLDELDEHGRQLGARAGPQPLVAVASPVGQEHQVAATQPIPCIE
jgi:hypothetical protein